MKTERNILLLKLIVSITIQLVIYGVLFFWLVGTFRWWRGWVFVGVIFIGSVVAIVSIFPGNEALVRERLKPPIQKGQPLADKIALVLYFATLFGLIVFTPLDVFRFHLMGKPGTIVSSSGLVLMVAGWLIASLALKENPFAAPVVKYQPERQQTVVDTGVYGIVRHPIYAGGILLIIGMPLWLESYAGALFAITPIAMVVLRILAEERFLLRELKGYDAYIQRVQYRLVPFLW
jgi:protein-S-isoprenylcysteine O-methyltransferase Ste14